MKNYLPLLFFFFANCNISFGNIFQIEWIGNLDYFGQFEHIQIYSEGDSTFVGLPDRGPVAKFLVQNLSADKSIISFQIIIDQLIWKFNGNQKQSSRIEGNFTLDNGLKATVTLFQTLPNQKSEWAAFLGAYQIQGQPKNEFLIITKAYGRLRLHSALSQRYSLLKKIGENLFYSGSNELLELKINESQKYIQINWTGVNGQTLQAKRTPGIKIEDHEINYENEIIGVSLYLPAGSSELNTAPALIIPMGAANYDRSLVELEAEIFATYGIATLIYDNYGNGISTGNLREKTFQDKKDQSIHLYKWLEKKPGIDPLKIGFRGGSQSGRISAMAASELPETYCLLLLATPMETRMDQQIYAIAEYHRQQGFGEDHIAQASEIWRRHFLSAASQTIDTTYVELAQDLFSKQPEMELPRPTLDTPAYFPWQSDILDATRDYLPKINCPILCQFGTLDDRVPAQKSINILQNTLAELGKNPPVVITYPGASHSFMFPGYRVVPGVFMHQVRFVLGEE